MKRFWTGLAVAVVLAVFIGCSDKKPATVNNEKNPDAGKPQQVGGGGGPGTAPPLPPPPPLPGK